MSNVDPAAVIPFATALRAQARVTHQRRLLVLAGEAEWGRHCAAGVARSADSLWIGAQGPASIPALPAAKALAVLGGEYADVVLDAHEGLDPDVLGAVGGTVSGGGLLILLAPPLDDWPDRVDPGLTRIAPYPHGADAFGGGFIARLATLLRTRDEAVVVAQAGPLPVLPATPERPPANAVVAASADDGCLSEDQRHAVEAVLHVVRGHRRRPVVLIADRGRGKSAALGIAAARLMADGACRILVTAPRRAAAGALFEQARAALPDAEDEGAVLRLGAASLAFVAADELLRAPREADLLLVDEAAALPAPLLERLLRRYARIAFATTVHGYEGSGRGFALRFSATLDRLTPGWRTVTLETPVRWGADDPVERLLFRALLLDARPAPAETFHGTEMSSGVIERLDRARLANDETTLTELFGLLVLAHYRTTPGDLRQLLDAPDVEVHVVRIQGHVAATLLAVREGGLDANLASAIHAGTRRVRGHLLAQSLAAHAGLMEAPCLQGLRVLRIAVHPALRRRGLGSRLLEAVARRATDGGIDYLGASFGAADDLLGFWTANRCPVARVGLRREASSGSHALQVLRGLSPAGRALAVRAATRHAKQFPALLGGPLCELEPALAATLLSTTDADHQGAPAADDLADAVTFAFGLRGADVALPALQRLLPALLATADAPSAAEERAALVARFMQHRPWQEVAALLGVPGRQAATARLRHVLRTPLLALGGEDAASRAAWLEAGRDAPR